jgi:CO/xanthine dehydrogenase FAD-binding subunit
VRGSFEYVRPTTIEEACSLLREGAGSALAYAGGTDLLVDIRNGVRSPKLLVDIKSIEPLRRLDLGDPGGAITIGPAVFLNRIAEHADLRDRHPALAGAALSIATYQLRNRATIGGNLCNASPASDSIPPLLVVGTALTIQGPGGSREVPLDCFCTGVKKTCLELGEIVTEIRIPPIAPGTRTAFLKQQRIRGHDLAVVNLAGALSPGDGLLTLAVGSCTPTPLLLEPIETSGHSLRAVAEEAVRVAGAGISPISDVRASAEYRRAVLPALVRRLVAELMNGKGAA